MSSRILARYDLTVIGTVRFAESLSGITASIIDTLNEDLHINFIPTSNNHLLQDLSNKVIGIISKQDAAPGKVAILSDIIWHTAADNVKLVPNSDIKIAYSMLESDAIPEKWVDILNKNFDSVVVPDDFYKNVYEKCKVKIPVFVLPCLMHLKDLLNQQIKRKNNFPFKFGISCLLNPNKNLDLLVKSFGQAFKNNNNVELVIHSRCENPDYLNKLINLAKVHKIKKFNFFCKRFSREEYISFLKDLDCYVSISKGEGFSMVPREALALGIPCILSNNTAQKTICNTGLVRSIDANIKEFAYYEHLGGIHGYCFNCRIKDIKEALLDVYANINKFRAKAKLGRNWVAQYSCEYLKKRYLSLFSPKKVLLGDKNFVDADYLMTNSITLYKKYLLLNKGKK